MISWLVGLGLSPRAAKLALIIGGALLAAFAFYAILDAYGDSRYREGKKEEAAAWQAASDKLIQKAQNGAAKADKAAAARQADFAARVEEEKERIDATKVDGSSPFDVLFNADGG